MITKDLSLDQYLKIFRKGFFFSTRNWKKIAIIGIVGMIFGFLYSFTQKTYYKAEISFSIQESDVFNSKTENIFLQPTLSKLVKSKLIINKTLLSKVNLNNSQINLIEYYLKIHNQKPTKEEMFFDNFNDKQNKILEDIYLDVTSNKNLQIDFVSPKATILKIIVKSENEYFAYFFCRNLFLNFSEFYTDYKSKKINNEIIIQKKIIDSIKEELNLELTRNEAQDINIFHLNKTKTVLNTQKNINEIKLISIQNIFYNLSFEIEKNRNKLKQISPVYNVIDAPVLPLVKIKNSRSKETIKSGLFFGLASFIIFILAGMKKQFN